MEEKRIDIKAQALELFRASPIFEYGVTEEKLQKAFENIHIMSTYEELLNEYNPYERYNGKLEGFSRAGQTYIGPNATPHVIIHEILHDLSSEFDEKGHRTVNGIAQNVNDYSQTQLNEGIVDYVASKISKENVTHYETEKSLFERLEPMLVAQTNNPDVMFQILLQDKNRINEFVQEFAKPQTADKIIKGFQFMNKEAIQKATDEIEKTFYRKQKIDKFKRKINSIFPFLNKQKALPPGKQSSVEKRTPEQKFRDEYKFIPLDGPSKNKQKYEKTVESPEANIENYEQEKE